MITVTSTEIFIKYATSIAFRMLIIVYSIFILLTEDNLFHPMMYILTILIYLYIYWTLLMKQKPIIRTINDYLFILIILIGKDIFEFQNMIYLLFPIINAPNHTQNKRQPFLLLFLSFMSFLILNMFNEKGIDIPAHFYLFISFSSLVLITYFEYYRSSIINKLLNIYNQIDIIVSKKSNTTQIPEIYNLIIQKLNEEANINVIQIIGFEYEKEHHLIVKNSSLFVHKFNINDVMESLKTANLVINKNIVINSIESDSNFAIKIENFIFLIITQDKIKPLNFLNAIKVYEILIPIFKKIIKIMEAEKLFQKQKFKTLSFLNAKSKYVNTIMKSTHYLSNQFSPISNYFDLKKEYDSLPDSEENLKPQLLIILNDEEERARISIQNISDRSLRILDKEDSPFIPDGLKEKKYKLIYMIIKDVWKHYFSDNDIETKNFTEHYENTLLTDLNSLEYICSDLFENIRKYSLSHHRIEFDFEDSIQINIVNDIKNFEGNKTEILEIVKNFNNNEKIEINKRKGYGLSHVKELSLLLNIDITLSVDQDKGLFHTKLHFIGDRQ